LVGGKNDAEMRGRVYPTDEASLWLESLGPSAPPMSCQGKLSQTIFDANTIKRLKTVAVKKAEQKNESRKFTFGFRFFICCAIAGATRPTAKCAVIAKNTKHNSIKTVENQRFLLAGSQ